MQKRGRKKKEYPNEEIEEIVYRFTQEEKQSGWIKYLEVYRYAKKLYEIGEIPYKFSDEFWQRAERQGRKAIDRANNAYKATITNSKNKITSTYVDTEECVNKFFSGKPSDRNRLIQALIINEKKAKELVKALDNIDNFQKEISAQSDKIQKLEYLIKQQQKILFSWFNASVKSDVPLINLITTGKTRHPIVELFFETAFSSPEEGLEVFNEYRRNVKKSESKTNDKIVSLNRKNSFQKISEQYEED